MEGVWWFLFIMGLNQIEHIWIKKWGMLYSVVIYIQDKDGGKYVKKQQIMWDDSWLKHHIGESIVQGLV